MNSLDSDHDADICLPFWVHSQKKSPKKERNGDGKRTGKQGKTKQDEEGTTCICTDEKQLIQ